MIVEVQWHASAEAVAGYEIEPWRADADPLHVHTRGCEERHASRRPA
jgi:hypothetical protein